ncbi:hypothetical protein [uncultured Flavobacterium sp.]|uniref:hypothetical protein n=1 Tax=uncultured Flavobacterium sp. TaxID=165435 RepID=UPI0025F61D91|nr:hypothetical protein [uncultured Flavobacterium sp.]
MIDKVLKNLVYLLYPRNLSFDRENSAYIASEEYLRLSQIIRKFDSEIKDTFSKDILKEFEDDYTLKHFADNTLFSWGDRCMTFNVAIIEDGEMYTISLLLSVVIPYYVVRCTKKKDISFFYSALQLAEIAKANQETRKIGEIINKLQNVIEDKFLYNKFPDKILGLVVEDVSFQEAGFGHFNLFNAFFNNLIITRNEE